MTASSPDDTPGTTSRIRRVMAICSSGGHWVELRRLSAAWKGCDITYVTTSAVLGDDIEHIRAGPGTPGQRFFAVPDANRWNKLQVASLAFQVSWLVLRYRPHVIVSTGSAPGYLAFRVGKLIGARTVWLESIANVEALSMSGRKVAPHADLWLTQWEHQVDEVEVDGKRMTYAGKVL